MDELAKRLRQFIDNIKGDLDGCPVNDATHMIGFSHKGWHENIKLLEKVAAVLSGVRVPVEPNEETPPEYLDKYGIEESLVATCAGDCLPRF